MNDQRTEFTILPVVKTGQPVPTQYRERESFAFRRFGPPAVTVDGQVAIVRFLAAGGNNRFAIAGVYERTFDFSTSPATISSLRETLFSGEFVDAKGGGVDNFRAIATDWKSNEWVCSADSVDLGDLARLRPCLFFVGAQGQREPLVQALDPIPNTQQTYAGFAEFSLDEGNVVFKGQAQDPTLVGIYQRLPNGSIERIVDSSMDFQGHKIYDCGAPMIRGGNIVFQVVGSDRIYRRLPNGLNEEIARTGSRTPERRNFRFESFGPPAVDRQGNTAFWGRSQSRTGGVLLEGIYKKPVNDSLKKVADTEDGVYRRFIPRVSINNGDVLFRGSSSVELAIVGDEGRVTVVRNTLDAMTLNNLAIGPEAIVDNAVVFLAGFTDLVEGIYIAWRQ